MNVAVTHIKQEAIESFLADTAFIFFFCSPLIKGGFKFIFSLFNMSDLSSVFVVAVVYLPILLLLISRPKKVFKLDFFLLYIFVVLFFVITLLLYPEYEYWYRRSGYGVWSYVLFPTEAIYAYFFIRLFDDDPQRLKRNMKISGWFMYIYFIYQIYASLQLGYWYGVSATSSTHEMAYSVAFGYNVLFFALFFLYDTFLYRKFSDIVAATIGLSMILTQGSRGPVLFIGIFLILMVLMQLKKSKVKWLILFFLILLTAGFWLFYEQLFLALGNLLASLNLSSRFIAMLVNGTVTSDNGRIRIWTAAWNMVKDRPLGYGAMGSQHVISAYVLAGYPHSVILEILIDFGVVIGTLLLGFLGHNASQMLFKKENETWSDVFLIFFCSACSLFISLCFWSTPAFWACIAIGVNCYIGKRKKKEDESDDTNINKNHSDYSNYLGDKCLHLRKKTIKE